MTRTRIVLLLCAMFALTVGVATAIAGGGNSNNAKLCQKDGWKTQYRSEDGTSFNNQGGMCVLRGERRHPHIGGGRREPERGSGLRRWYPRCGLLRNKRGPVCGHHHSAQ